MAVTVGAAQVHLGWLNTPIALVIALVKATLIVLFFMHVRYASPLVRIFAAGGFVWLVILFALTFSDYFTRH
jgi:cytochrome c oxidase subunit 4